MNFIYTERNFFLFTKYNWIIMMKNFKISWSMMDLEFLWIVDNNEGHTFCEKNNCYISITMKTRIRATRQMILHHLCSWYDTSYWRDFNSKVGKQDFYKGRVWKHCLQDIKNGNIHSYNKILPNNYLLRKFNTSTLNTETTNLCFQELVISRPEPDIQFSISLITNVIYM